MSRQASLQKGFSLVELMIAMALGLLITAAALQMSLTSRDIKKTTDEQSRIQENGRFALFFLSQHIRMAGYNSSDSPAASGKVFWDGACGSFDPCTNDGGNNVSDRIAVILDPTNNADCLGTDVGDDVIANVYYVDDPDADGINSLYCRGYDLADNSWYSDSALPLVDGVENMQILYGIANPAANNTITRYVSADNAPNWVDIGSAKVALLISNGQTTGNSTKAVRTFSLLDATDLSFDDKHNRRVFTATTVINNILYQSEETNI